MTRLQAEYWAPITISSTVRSIFISYRRQPHTSIRRLKPSSSASVSRHRLVIQSVSIVFISKMNFINILQLLLAITHLH